jgi:hypothetical protein
VADAVAVAVEGGVVVGVAVDETVGVAVALGMRLGVAVGVALGVAVGVGVALRVGEAVGVVLGEAVGVTVAVAVGVTVAVGASTVTAPWRGTHGSMSSLRLQLAISSALVPAASPCHVMVTSAPDPASASAQAMVNVRRPTCGVLDSRKHPALSGVFVTEVGATSAASYSTVASTACTPVASSIVKVAIDEAPGPWMLTSAGRLTTAAGVPREPSTALIATADQKVRRPRTLCSRGTG